MTAPKRIYVRHLHTGEIKQVTADERDAQDKNYWVRVTGDVKPTTPATAEPAETPAPKTASKTDTSSK